MNVTRISTAAAVMFSSNTYAHPLSKWLSIFETQAPQPEEPLDQSMIEPPEHEHLLDISTHQEKNDGITLSTHLRPGSDFHQLEGTLKTKGNLAQAENLLLEPENIQQWFDGLECIEVTEKKDQQHFQLQAQTKAFNLLFLHIPAREIHLECQQKSNATRQSTTLIMNRLPPPTDHDDSPTIYAKAFEGKITITQHRSNQLEIQFHCHLEPGGRLPAWAVNKATSGSIIKSLRNAQKLLNE